uniref:MFS domain-containing protein n=1 Tax=Parastrongyloides trichosuri TaxID=131310 RepID=A0A0N4ZE55_PARTI
MKSETTHSLDREKKNKLLVENSNKIHYDLGNYQLILFIISNIGLFPTAASMLVTILFEPSQEYCNAYNNGTLNTDEDSYKNNFYSLFMEWQYHCMNSYLHKVITTFVMVGGTIGAVTSGYISDNHGRKPIIVGSMVLMAITNLIISFTGKYGWQLFSIIFFVQGCGVGAYMSSHLILIMENLENPRSRLLIVCLNAWPVGLCFTAFISYLTKHWIYFHILNSIISMIMAALLHFFAHESHIWLNQNNLQVKALKIKTSINKFNNKCINKERGHLPIESLRIIRNNKDEKNVMLTTSTIEEDEKKKLTTLEIIRMPKVRKHLLVLAFSFLSSSIVSFVMYFSLDTIPGNPFVKMLLMGMLKFIAGLSPYFLSRWLGRMKIYLFSLTLSLIGSWILITLYYIDQNVNGIFLSILSQLLAATTDPVFKINHLYSAELFPTTARNTCRGICNGASRIGSMLAPGIILLRYFHTGIPYTVIGLLITTQWLLGYFYLPETKNQMSLDENNEGNDDFSSHKSCSP